MIDLINNINEQNNKLRSLRDEANSKVKSIIKTYNQLRREKAFKNDSKDMYETSEYAIFKVHNMPEDFEDFEKEGKNVIASGTYYGRMGYTDYCRVFIPARWFSYSQERLEAAMMRRWSQFLNDKMNLQNKEEEEKKRKRLEEYQKLKDEFG